MILQSPVVNNTTVYYQMNSTNKSFLEMVDFLNKKGIKNDRFFMVLFDPDLYNINPHDPRLNAFMKKKIFNECLRNYWYFLREVIRIEDQGSTSGGIPYRLHRGNLALNYCTIMNLNIFLELPRQFGKTISICCRLLWVYLFGTTNSQMLLLNKKHDDSKLNLERIKTLRKLLPTYLQLNDNYGANGSKVKSVDRAETISNVTNGNAIKTVPAARNPAGAQNIGRGNTQPIQWYDEFAFIPYNKDIFNAATPAYSKASENAKRNGAPFGILISTTPGELTNNPGLYAFKFKEMATKFTENWYDLSYQDVMKIVDSNDSSTFVYIKFTYTQLGAGQAYLTRMIREMQKDWVAIRREVLLEWAKSSTNSPFTEEELSIVKNYIREPIARMKLGRIYDLNIYEPINPENPPIIGVDVSGGYYRDSSTITIIDSSSTRVVADLNCNYLSPNDLAYILVELVTKYCPNAVVNIERNGGFGASVVSALKDSPIKRNLYYEVKDKVIEERYDGFKINQKKVKTRVFGLDSSKVVRDLLIEILRQRMENHKDKFISPIIFEELNTLEVKSNGKVEHSSTGHDDQIFSYLMALYVWYYGEDLRENWGIKKGTIDTDRNVAEEILSLEDQYQDFDVTPYIKNESINNATGLSEEDLVEQQMKYIQSVKTYSQGEWFAKEFIEDEKAMEELLRTPVGRKAYKEKTGATDEEINSLVGFETNVSNKIYRDFYGDEIEDPDANFTNPDDVVKNFFNTQFM